MVSTSSPKPFSIRMSAQTLARLDERAQRRREPKARTAERLIDEGLRMEDHPGIAFRDGPTGRRAALAGGPDVWEVIDTLKAPGLTGERAIAATAAWGNLTTAQVASACATTPSIATRSMSGSGSTARTAERQRVAWQRMQDALG